MMLFERGLVYLAQQDSLPVEIRRGMAILTKNGQKAGQIAAVLLNNDSQTITHLLFAPWPQLSDYRLATVDLIKQVTGEMVLLHLGSEAIACLPRRPRDM